MIRNNCNKWLLTWSFNAATQAWGDLSGVLEPRLRAHHWSRGHWPRPCRAVGAGGARLAPPPGPAAGHPVHTGHALLLDHPGVVRAGEDPPGAGGPGTLLGGGRQSPDELPVLGPVVGSGG